MGLKVGLGFFSTKKSVSTSGEARSLIGSYGSHAPRARFGTFPLDLYGRSKGPAAPPTSLLPVFSDTKDIGVFIRAMAAATLDLGASITADSSPLIRARIVGIASIYFDVFASIFSLAKEVDKDLFTSIRGICSTNTSPLTYQSTIIGTPLGFAVIDRLITAFPDITATIAGWRSFDLGATVYVVQRDSFDFGASVGALIPLTGNITASIIATYTYDLGASITNVEPKDLLTTLTSIPGVALPASLVPIPPFGLAATVGGHLPEDLIAILNTVQPVDLSVFMRAGFSGTLELNATISAAGSYLDMTSRVNVRSTSVDTFPASITARIPFDLRAYIDGFGSSDLLASIAGVYSNDINAVVIPIHSEFSNMPSFIRVSYALVSNLGVQIHGFISAHTTNKPDNFSILPRPARPILIAQRLGLTILTIEPIRGAFPDLGASVVAIPISTFDMRAFIRGTTADLSDVVASISAVTKSINISKIVLGFVNLKDLNATITAFSGYKGLLAGIRGVVQAQTGTPSGSGWVMISSTVRFYIGTDKGLLMPERKKASIRIGRFINTSLTPDLRAHLAGWATSSFLASISVQPHAGLAASIGANDLTHIKALSATMIPFHTIGLSASVSASGGFFDVPASVTSAGFVSGISASIYPYIKVFGHRVISIYTKPFLDMKALVNAHLGFSCSFFSGFLGVSAFIRSTVTLESGADLAASITSGRDILDIRGSIEGKKVSRIRTLSLQMRLKIRRSEGIFGSISGFGQDQFGLLGSITPVVHQLDLGASVSALRHSFSAIDSNEILDIYSLKKGTGYLLKRFSLFFSAKVSQYIYDSVDKVVYPLDDGKWKLNLTEFTETGLFFDRATTSRTVVVDSLVEYDSIDEAIRAAIDILVSGYKVDMSASISATGGYLGMVASIVGDPLDRVSNLPAKLMVVTNLPDLAATISAFSGYFPLGAYIKPVDSGVPDINASILGVIYTGLLAEITAV